MGKRISLKRLKSNKIDFILREHQKGFKAYLTRRLTQSAGDQSVEHMSDKHQFPKLINQVVTTFLPLMIRLPSDNCKLQDWLTEWL